MTVPTIRRSRRGALAATGAILALVSTHAQAGARRPPSPPSASVELELMTWPEVKAALAAGKTTALIYTGGAEQRGPQNVIGGHTFMGRATVKAIAEQLGDAIAFPVLPYTPNEASAELPGAIGLTKELLGLVLERIAEQAIVTGFRNVILMGDHGTGQGPGGVYEAVAKALDAKYASQGIHVFHCPQVYAANATFDTWAKSQGYPATIHAGLSDTSEMLYLDPDGGWVRKSLLATAIGDPIGEDGKRRIGPDSPRNGVTGDARRSSAALGKRLFDLKVAAAVAEIRSVVPKP